MRLSRLLLVAAIAAVLTSTGCRRCCNDTSYKGCPAPPPPAYYPPATGCP